MGWSYLVEHDRQATAEGCVYPVFVKIGDGRFSFSEMESLALRGHELTGSSDEHDWPSIVLPLMGLNPALVVSRAASRN